MPSSRRARVHADLRLADLKRRFRGGSRLKSIRVPVEFADAIASIAGKLGVTKLELTTALLNDGLQVAAQALDKWRAQRKIREEAGLLETVGGRVTRRKQPGQQ